MENTNENKEHQNFAIIRINDLNEEEIQIILKHRSKQGKSGLKYFLSKEPLYLFKDFRRSCMREIVKCIFLYLTFKYGISELFLK